MAKSEVDQTDCVVGENQDIVGADVAMVDGNRLRFTSMDGGHKFLEQIEAFKDVAVEWVGVGG